MAERHRISKIDVLLPVCHTGSEISASRRLRTL
jgi:hypothetical protein